MSDHSVKIVAVTLLPHGNADTLSVVMIGGYSCVVRTADWAGKSTAAYCVPDTLVPVGRAEFAFLEKNAYRAGHFADGFARIRAMKLRGVWSEGLLIPCEGAIGDDVTEKLGCRWWSPPETEESEGVEGYTGKTNAYDVENIKRCTQSMVNGETVVATEKLHGANGRWRYDANAGRFWCGSRVQWKKDAPGSLWWAALRQSPSLMQFLKLNPHLVVFGEAVGQVTGFKYNGIEAVGFDVFDTLANRWMDKLTALRILSMNGIATVPVIYHGPFSMDALLPLAEGKSVHAPSGARCREGLVISPVTEREDEHIGRVILKLVGRGFLEKD